MQGLTIHESTGGRVKALALFLHPGVFLLLALLVSGVCPVFAGDALDREASQKWYSMGKYFHSHAGDSLKAVECLQKALDKDSSNEPARTLLNQIRSELGLQPEVKSVDRDQSRGWLNKGRYLENFRNDLQGAMEAYEKALVFDPENSEASSLLSLARQRAKFTLEVEQASGLASEDFKKAEQALTDSDLVTALDNYRRGLEKFPNNTRALIRFFRIAQNLDNQNDVRKALELMRDHCRFAMISADDLLAMDQELHCYQTRVRATRAINFYNRDHKILTDYLDEFSASFIKEQWKELDQYRRELSPMRVLDMEALARRGYLDAELTCSTGGGTFFLNESGMVECTLHGVVEDIRGLKVKMDKDYLAGGSPESSKAPENAEQWVQQTQAPETTQVRSREVFNSAVALGDFHFREGRYQDALRLYQKAVDTDPSDPLGYNKKGNALLHSGDVDGALMMYRNATDKDKYFHEAYSNQGTCLARQGKLKDAVEALEKAVTLASDRAEYHFNLGVIYSKMGQDKLAVETLSKACEINPEDFSSRYQLAFVLARQRKLADAIRELKVLRRSADLTSRIKGVLDSMIRDLQHAEKKIPPPREEKNSPRSLQEFLER